MSSNQIKVIAIVAMFLNHIYHIFMRSPQSTVTMELMRLLFRHIGAITFMLMIFMIVEGFEKTKNRTKYTYRLFLFFIISFVPFSLFATSRFFDGTIRPFLSVERFLGMIYGASFIDTVFIYIGSSVFNVIFTLFCGFLMLMLIQNTKSKISEISILLFFVMVSFPSDWGGIGVIGIYIMYKLPKHNRPMWGVLWFFIISTINATIIDIYFFSSADRMLERIVNYAGIYSLMLVCIPILDRYNGERGTYNLKYLFYIFYPLHMLILFFIYVFK